MELKYCLELRACTEETLHEAVEQMGKFSHVIKDYFF
jgi:hypothetical protein